MRGGFVVITATLAALAVTPAAQGSVTRVDGTVIKRARDAHSFVLVTRTGRMLGIQARRSPRVGRTARVGARRLSTGRYSARSIQILGRRQTVRLRGAVSARDVQRRVFRLSTRGASVLVHAESAASLPRRGTRADVRASIDRRGRLRLISLRKDSAAATPTPGKAGQGSSRVTINAANGGGGGGGGGGRPGTSGGSSSGAAVKRGGFIFMDGILLAVDPKARTFRVAPEDESEDEADPASPEEEDPLARDAGAPQYGPPVTLSVERSIDLSRFQAGQKVRLVLRRLSTGELVVEEADVAKKDDGSERDPDDGPDDGEGPDAPLQD